MGTSSRLKKWLKSGVSGEPPAWVSELVREEIDANVRRGVEAIDERRGGWDVVERIYRNELPMDEWGEIRRNETEGIEGTGFDSVGRTEEWRSQLVSGMAHLVQGHVHQIHGAIFGSEDWLRVSGGPSDGQGVEDEDYSTADKIGELLRSGLSRCGIHGRVYDALLAGALFGNAFGTISWDRRAEAGRLMVLKPDRVLVDPYAVSADPQSWRFCGYFTECGVETVRARAGGGRWNCNLSEVDRRWGNVSPGGEDGCRVTEYHGLVLIDDEDVEVIATFVTDGGRRGESGKGVADGLLVRLVPGPALSQGRPIFNWAFNPMLGPYGLGVVGPQMDLLYTASQLMNVLVDDAKLTGNAMFYCPPGRMARDLENDPELRPGRVFVGDPGEGLKAVEIPGVRINELRSVVAYLEGELSGRTASASISGGGNRTATEVSFIESQMRLPADTRSELFVRGFLNPVLSGVLELTQIFGKAQSIQVRDVGGVERSVWVGRDEIGSGVYRAEATLGRPETLRIAHAQSIERVLPSLLQVEPMLGRDGYRIDYGALLRVYLEKLNIPRANEIVVRSGVDGDAAGGVGSGGHEWPEGAQGGTDQEIKRGILTAAGGDASGRVGQL